MSRARSLEPSKPRSRPLLTWTDGAGDHALDLTERCTTGSAHSCEIVVTDKLVSRIHLDVDPAPDGLWVRDLGSRNGTYVNGVKVIEARVPSGSVVGIGTTDITVTYGEPPPHPRGQTERENGTFGQLESRSASMREIFATLEDLASTDRSIVIEGEPGTGKKALARALHDASARAGEPFVVLECAGLPAEAAVTDRIDEALDSADGGTLVIDTPGDLPIAVQRNVEQRLGAKSFRVVVTTHHDLRRLVNCGAFRESLYFSLAGKTVRVPPIRERSEDIAPLLERFLGEQKSLLTPAVLADLERWPWMGNVSELRLHAGRLRESELARSGRTRLDPITEPEGEPRREDDADSGNDTTEAPTIRSILGLDPTAVDVVRTLPTATLPWLLVGFKEFRERWIELGEREYLRQLMQRTNRSSSAAARESGLERTYLYRLIKKHGV